MNPTLRTPHARRRLRPNLALLAARPDLRLSLTAAGMELRNRARPRRPRRAPARQPFALQVLWPRAVLRLPAIGGWSLWSRQLPPALFAASTRYLSAAFQHPRALPVARWFDLIGPRVSPRDAAEITAHIASVEPATLQRLLHSCQAHSAHAVLASLRLPLLIIAGDKDPFAPSERVGVLLQRAAPGSELLRLANGTHTAMLEEPERIAQAVERFLDRN